jgi:hypothetical protein
VIDVLVVVAILITFALLHALVQRWAGGAEPSGRQLGCTGWVPR